MVDSRSRIRTHHHHLADDSGTYCRQHRHLCRRARLRSGFCACIYGSFIATLGVSLPSFIIVYFVARSLEKFSQSRLVKEALCGIRPAVIAFMITAVIFFLDITVFPIDNATSESSTFNPIGMPVLAVLFYLHYYRKVGAISLMLISGIIGVLVY